MRDPGLREQVALLRTRIHQAEWTGGATPALDELTDLLFKAGKISAAMNLVEKYLAEGYPAEAQTEARQGDPVEPLKPQKTSTPPDDDADLGRKLFERGLEFADAFLYEEAVETLEAALKLAHSPFETHYCLAGVRKSLSHYDEAEKHIRSSLALNPAFAPAHVLLGEILKPAGRLTESIAACKRALLLDPESAAAYYDLACYYALLNASDKSLAALEMALCKGFLDFEWLAQDPDLALLRERPEFVYLLQKYRPGA
jgi:tetratricopeptide (TPR) repeat protein